MSNKVKAMFLIMVMIIALSATTILIMLMEPCEYCKSKFCFGNCTIVYEDGTTANPNTIKPNSGKTNQKTTRIAETERMDESYLDKLVFIGDSRTIGLKLNYNLSDDKIFAEDGLNHEAALTKKVVKLQEYKSISIPEAVKVTAPPIMVVGFGINGISWMSVNQFIEGYEKLVDELITSSPNSIVVIQAIMPVSANYEMNEGGVTNEKIDEANDALYEMAKEKGLYYLGVNEVLKNDNNDLIDGYHSGDGIHYNKKAYEVIVDYILTHAIIKK